MLTISRQYSFGTDKAIVLNVSRAVCFDKGTKHEYLTQKSKTTLLSGKSNLLSAWQFRFQTFQKFQYCSLF